MPLRLQIAALVSFVFLLGSPVEATEASPLPPTQTMRAVFQEIKMLIPLSLNENQWSSPEARERILASLGRLEHAASALQQHGSQRESGFRELAINLSGDFHETRERYRLEEYEQARFFLFGSLQNCVSCHIRLPAAQRFPFAQELMAKEQVEALAPREQAWLLVTLRQFDDALSIWEEMIADPEISASELDATGVMEDYMNVAIRVRGDVPRVAKTIERFEKRSDAPIYLKRRLREWRTALADLDPEQLAASGAPSLEAGVALARKAVDVSAGPYGRDGLVHDLAAASILVRWLETDRASAASITRNRTPEERQNTARAYYWLGVVEARSLDNFWVNLSELHLEAAIRSDPTGPLAETAYSLLEETQILGYGGSSGVHLPTDVWNLLRELRQLMGIED